MSVHRLLTAATAAPLGIFGLATPAAAHVSAQSAAADAYTLTPGRLVGTVAVLVALVGVVIGGLALARSAGRIGTGTGRRGAIVALGVGLISLLVGGLHAANAAGGFGTGNGLAGAIVAMVVGLVGMVLGGLAMARSRRAT